MQIRITWLVAGLLGAAAVVALLVGSDPAGESGARGSPERGSELEEAAITTGAGPVLSTVEGATDDTAPDERAPNTGPPPVTARATPSGEVAAEIGGGTATDSQPVEVGEYIDPEGFPVEQDTPVIRIGDYLDPDSDFSGD